MVQFTKIYLFAFPKFIEVNFTEIRLCNGSKILAEVKVSFPPILHQTKLNVTVNIFMITSTNKIDDNNKNINYHLANKF